MNRGQNTSSNPCPKKVQVTFCFGEGRHEAQSKTDNMIRFHCENSLSRKNNSWASGWLDGKSHFLRCMMDLTIKNIKRFSTDFYEGFNTVCACIHQHWKRSLLMEMRKSMKHVTCTWLVRSVIPFMANGLIIICFSCGGLETSNSFKVSNRLHQHKKGSSWIAAKIPVKFYYETVGKKLLKFQFIREKISTSYFMYLLRYGPRKKMGRQNSCAGRNWFFTLSKSKIVSSAVFAMEDFLETLIS